MIVFVLTIEDATHLGGPMGTERTDVIGTEVFETKVLAQAFAEKKEKKKGQWQHLSGRWTWDAGGKIYSIKSEKVRGS